MPQGASLKLSGEPSKAGRPDLLDLDLADVEGVVEIFIDSDDCIEDDFSEASTSGQGVFTSAQEVFVVRRLSKAVAGFRPAVTCEGYLANVSRTSSGYSLLPHGSDQQLSFKYEPPSPKFSCSRPGCISYRLQLLHGSQFLYSLRGLPKALRCQRSAHALSWGPVQLVFAASVDLDTFLATLKYVEVQQMEVTEGPEWGQPGSAAAGSSAGRGAVACGCIGVPWPSAAAALWKDGHRGQGLPHAPAAASGSSCSCRGHGPAPVFAATAGTAVLAAVAAACLLTQRGGGGSGSAAGGGCCGVAPSRKRAADS